MLQRSRGVTLPEHNHVISSTKKHRQSRHRLRMPLYWFLRALQLDAETLVIWLQRLSQTPFWSSSGWSKEWLGGFGSPNIGCIHQAAGRPLKAIRGGSRPCGERRNESKFTSFGSSPVSFFVLSSPGFEIFQRQLWLFRTRGRWHWRKWNLLLHCNKYFR